MPYSTCIIVACTEVIKTRGLCIDHYKLHMSKGTLDKVALPSKTPPANVAPIGTKKVGPDGYVMVKVDSSRWIGEHRLVAQRVLGRELVKGETVHHINGDRSDNRVKNLELWYSPQPYGQRVTDLIDYMVAHHRPRLEKAMGLPRGVLSALVRHSFGCALPMRGGVCTCGPEL